MPVNNSHSKIFISVVIPHYNMPDHLDECITCIEKQSIGRQSIEVIVIDNGSTRQVSQSLIKRVDQWLSYDITANPYTCRNIGIRAANCDQIALLDCKCRPTKVWAYHVIRSLSDYNVGGGPLHKIVDTADIYSLYYGYSHLNTALQVYDNGPLVAGNLFFRRNIIDKVGYLPETSRSGGDIKWSQSVIECGIDIGYAAGAVVHINAKSKAQVIRSERRFGRGAYLQNRDKSWSHHLKMILYHLLPDKPSRIRRKINAQPDPSVYSGKLWSLWWVTWHTHLLFLQGYLSGILLPDRELYID